MLGGDHSLTTAAIRDTRGVALVSGNKLASTYYSATCGGHTSDIERAWPQRESAPYLRGRRDSSDDGGPFCQWVHNFRWRFTYTGRQLGAVLRETLPKELCVPASWVGHLRNVRVTARGPSGRVRTLLIETTSRDFSVSGDRIRWVLMPDPEGGRDLG